MQKVAAYLLERRDSLEWPESRKDEAQRIKHTVLEWLHEKGASRISFEGAFQPEGNSKGTYSIEEAIDKGRSWWLLRLQEQSPNDQCFTTSLSITVGAEIVSVYLTMETGWTKSRIMPIAADPRCPKIVRSLLALSNNWYLGSSVIYPLRHVRGFDDGEALATEISMPNRSIPIIIVSLDNYECALPKLDEKLAFDLAGLANVVTLDDEASWAITDSLGKPFSCFRGSVRLYWPQFSTHDDRFSHPLWTSERLQAISDDRNLTRERFRKQLRALIHRACVLSVIRPDEIDDIRDAARQRPLLELRSKASSSEEYLALADSYASDNERLREERKKLRKRIDQLEIDGAKLQADCQSLKSHLNAATCQKTTEESDEIAPDVSCGNDETLPQPDEVRYYKKHHDHSSHDVMIPVNDCGHNKWESANKADKAKKGVAKLEDGRNDWKRFQHCAKCTGGGMWKVVW